MGIALGIVAVVQTDLIDKASVTIGFMLSIEPRLHDGEVAERPLLQSLDERSRC